MTIQDSQYVLTFISIRRLVLAVIEDPYSIEQLREPRMNVLIVKPLVDRLYDEEDISVGMYEEAAVQEDANR
jgi:hypothetical protein